MPVRFEGNSQPNVSKDAKYHVKVKDGFKIEIPYEADEFDRWILATKEHPELVAMINRVRTDLNEDLGGAFYINEYKQVLVPDRRERIFYLAGIYTEPLRFRFDDGKRIVTISGEAVDLDGNPIPVGGPWRGLHEGLRYVLAAGGRDIYYNSSPRPDVIRTVRLSRCVGEDDAAQLASRVCEVKGFSGGRFYLNEWREMFAPLGEDDTATMEYLYIGHLSTEDPWFPQLHRAVIQV
jgi:hypothetical protein